MESRVQEKVVGLIDLIDSFSTINMKIMALEMVAEQVEVALIRTKANRGDIEKDIAKNAIESLQKNDDFIKVALTIEYESKDDIKEEGVLYNPKTGELINIQTDLENETDISGVFFKYYNPKTKVTFEGEVCPDCNKYSLILTEDFDDYVKDCPNCGYHE